MDPLSIKVNFSEKEILDLKKAELAMFSVLCEKAEDLLILRESLLRLQDRYYRDAGRRFLTHDLAEEELSKILLERNPGDEKITGRKEHAKKVLAKTKNQLEVFASLRECEYDCIFNLNDTLIRKLPPADIVTDIAGCSPPAEDIKILYNAVAQISAPHNDPSVSILPDRETLRAVFGDWVNKDNTAEIRRLADDLTRSIRAISTMKDKINHVEEEKDAINRTALHDLQGKIKKEKAGGRDLFEELLLTITRSTREKKGWIKKLSEHPEQKEGPFTLNSGDREIPDLITRGIGEISGYLSVCRSMDTIKHGDDLVGRAEACDTMLILYPIGLPLPRAELEAMLHDNDVWNRLFTSFILSKTGIFMEKHLINLVALMEYGIEEKLYNWVTFALDALCKYDAREFRFIRSKVIPTFQQAIASDAPLLSYDELKKAREDAFEDEYYTPARDHICNNHNFKRVMINKLIDWGQYAKEAIDAALASLTNPDEIVRAEVVLAFHEAAEKGKFPGAYADDIIKTLLTMVHDESEMVRAFLAGTLGKICTATPEVIEALQALSDDAFATVTKYARESLALLEGKNEQQ